MRLDPRHPLASRAKPAVVRPKVASVLGRKLWIGVLEHPAPEMATKHRAKSPEQARPEANGLQAGITLPLRTARGLNNREHHFARARRVKREREAVAVALLLAHLEVTLTRISPRGGGDDDGDVGALKSVRDQVAAWLGIDDGLKHRLRFVYGEPERGPWAVRVEVRLVSR